MNAINPDSNYNSVNANNNSMEEAPALVEGRSVEVALHAIANEPITLDEVKDVAAAVAEGHTLPDDDVEEENILEHNDTKPTTEAFSPSSSSQSPQDPDSVAGPAVRLTKSFLSFTCVPGATSRRTFQLLNCGSTALYYDWVRDNDTTTDHIPTLSTSIPHKPHFFFPEQSGVLLPGDIKQFTVTFKTNMPGVFLAQYTLTTRPSLAALSQPCVRMHGTCNDEDTFKLHRRRLEEDLSAREKMHHIGSAIEKIFAGVNTPLDRSIGGDASSNEPDIGDYSDIEKKALFTAANVSHWPPLYYAKSVFVGIEEVVAEACSALVREHEEASIHKATAAIDNDSNNNNNNSTVDVPFSWDGSIATAQALISRIQDEYLASDLRDRLNKLVNAAAIAGNNTQIVRGVVYRSLLAVADKIQANEAEAEVEAEANEVDHNEARTRAHLCEAFDELEARCQLARAEVGNALDRKAEEVATSNDGDGDEEEVRWEVFRLQRMKKALLKRDVERSRKAAAENSDGGAASKEESSSLQERIRSLLAQNYPQ